MARSDWRTDPRSGSVCRRSGDDIVTKVRSCIAQHTTLKSSVCGQWNRGIDLVHDVTNIDFCIVSTSGDSMHERQRNRHERGDQRGAAKRQCDENRGLRLWLRLDLRLNNGSGC